jgi:cytochrome c551/c552
MFSPTASFARRAHLPAIFLVAATLGAFAPHCALAEAEHLPSGPWADWVEKDFPFFSSVLDARKEGPISPANNLTPRGLILNLGHDCWACFDTDLLRISAIWEGKGVTPEALAPLSYHDAGLKTLDGQTKLPKPDGRIWLANGIYPGWQIGDRASAVDPREPAPTPEEVGRGALPPGRGRFEAVRLTRGGLCLEYSIGTVQIREWISASVEKDARIVERRFRVEPSKEPLQLVVALRPNPVALQLTGGDGVTSHDEPSLWTVTVPPHPYATEFRVALSSAEAVPKSNPPGIVADADQPPAPRWPQVITTQTVLSTHQDAYVLDDIPLPLTNPWQRNVRVADVQFFRDGTAAMVTQDGDVWTVRGLGKTEGEVQWRRFTSGLHEPMSLAIRNDEIFVYDRNGIWRLRDTNGDGEADVHEMFSNAFAQTAETREFPSSMKLAPDGTFVISKGGQQSSTMGKHNGTVLRVSADGRSVTVLGWGFRGPFIGVHPRTGMVTASDQEGNYVPTTPLYIVDGGEYHGFLSQLLPKEQYPAPIAEPLTWIPHPVNPSGVTQVWLAGAKMGPLNDALLHLGYTRPEVFLVLLNQRFKKPQAAVVSLTHEVEFPLLNGAVNPADGQLYLAGFRGWGTTAPRLAGIARLRYTGAPSLFPKEVVAMDQGVLLRFDTALDLKRATDLASYSIERWNYQRTFKYGSPHLKLDGKPGQEWVQPSSVYLSKDGKGVFLGVPGMQPVMQMRVGWSLASRQGTTFDNNAYFTPYELAKFDPLAEGFEKIAVDLTPKAAVAQVAGPVSVEEGKRLYQFLGCLACHSTDGSLIGKVGPSWRGLFGSTRLFSDGTQAVADEAYLRQAILDPSAKVVRGFEKSEAGMPNYGGVVTDSQLESLILFIKTLGPPAP